MGQFCNFSQLFVGTMLQLLSTVRSGKSFFSAVKWNTAVISSGYLGWYYSSSRWLDGIILGVFPSVVKWDDTTTYLVGTILWLFSVIFWAVLTVSSRLGETMLLLFSAVYLDKTADCSTVLYYCSSNSMLASVILFSNKQMCIQSVLCIVRTTWSWPR